jgi:hypothetical protein
MKCYRTIQNNFQRTYKVVGKLWTFDVKQKKTDYEMFIQFDLSYAIYTFIAKILWIYA